MSWKIKPWSVFIQIDYLPAKNKIVFPFAFLCTFYFFGGDWVQANGTESSVNWWRHESRMKNGSFWPTVFLCWSHWLFPETGQPPRSWWWSIWNFINCQLKLVYKTYFLYIWSYSELNKFSMFIKFLCRAHHKHSGYLGQNSRTWRLCFEWRQNWSASSKSSV